MAGYPQGSGNPYGAPPANPYGSAPPQPYGASPPQSYGAAPGYGAPQPSAPYSKPEKPGKIHGGGGGGGYDSQPYGYSAPQQSEPYYKPEKPGKTHGVGGGGGYDSQPYGYGAPQQSEPYYKPEKPGKTHGGGGGGGYDSQPYGYGAPQQSEPYYKPEKPGKTHGVGGGVGYEQPPPAAGYGAASPFAALLPSQFPPGTDPSLVACFQIADQDGSGLIDDKELQRALSSYNQGFSLRTVHLLMYLFTSSNIRKIGPKEFISLFYSLQNWRAIFERFDRDRSGRIDAPELREALLSLGYAVSPVVLDLLLAKFDKSDGKYRAIEYDNFIECCLTVKGLTDKFKEKDTTYTGSATFTYESFMLTVLPFLIA